MSEIRAALFLAGVLVAAGSSSSAQSVVWAQRMGGAGFEATLSIGRGIQPFGTESVPALSWPGLIALAD